MQVMLYVNDVCCIMLCTYTHVIRRAGFDIAVKNELLDLVGKQGLSGTVRDQ